MTARLHNDALRALRLAAGLRQRELARLLGVSQVRISELETGKAPANGRAVRRAFAALLRYQERQR